MPSWDSLWTNVHLATMTEERGPYGAILEGALAIADRRIAWVGAEADLPHRDSRALIDGRGGWLTPGLIDCHTHLVFAGDRSGEFEQRLQGVSYEAIARAGGGIASTVAATRAASAGGAGRERRAPAGRVARERRDHRRDQVGLRARPRDRGQDARGRAPARARGPGSRCARASSAPTPCRASARPTGRAIWTWSASGCCRRSRPRAWPMRSTPSAKASPSARPRSRASSRRRGATACRSSCTPISSRIWAARRSRPASARSRPIIWNIPARRACGRWPRPAPWRSCCRAPSIPCARPGGRRSRLLRRHGVPIALATDCNPGSSPVVSLLAVLNMACTLFGLTPAGGARGRDPQCGASAWACRPRPAGRRPARRPCALADSATGRAQLLVRMDPAGRRTQGWLSNISRNLSLNLPCTVQELPQNCGLANRREDRETATPTLRGRWTEEVP